MTEHTNETLITLPIHQIVPNPKQPRRHFDEEALLQLAQSIRSQGVIQPLVVRPLSENQYELVAGERRWRALQLANIQEVDVVVRRIADHDVLEVALLENIQRENLTPIEEATCYRDLIDQHGYTQEALARRVGKDRSTIANLMRLLQLPTAVQNDLEEGRLTIGHTRPLLTLPHKQDQLELREQILKKKWSVRRTEKEVKAALQSNQSLPPKKQASAELSLHLMNLENELERVFGTKVSIQHQKNDKGSIKIDYYSLDDFDRIYEILKNH